MYMVVGGVWKDTSWKELVKTERYGPFQSYDEAKRVWAKYTWMNVDDAHSRYFIREQRI